MSESLPDHADPSLKSHVIRAACSKVSAKVAINFVKDVRGK